jgi:polyphosphate kinase
VTARIYTDIGLLTLREDLGADASELFNYLTGHSRQATYRKLLVAPVTLRDRLKSLIEREVAAHSAQGNGRIIFKVNAIVDARTIDALYAASCAGVQVDLIVRGMCCLRPGVPGLSENIRVRSIVGPHLEHSRVFYFRNAGNEEVYVGSADIMERNLDRRVEAVFPLEDPVHVRHVRDALLETYLRDNVHARILASDGVYTRCAPRDGELPVDSQKLWK